MLHLNQSANTASISSEENGWEKYLVPVEIDLNAQQAKGLVTFWYRKQGKWWYFKMYWKSLNLFVMKGDGVNFPKALITNALREPSEDLVIDLNDPKCRTLSVSGGKGQSLALLMSMDSSDVRYVQKRFK